MRVIIFIFSLIFTIHASESPIVQTTYGKVQGFEYENAEIFLAIPYAKPPVDDLRFERPVAPEPWEDVYPATHFRNDCAPHYRLVAQFSAHSGEDCLTLNIIKPKTIKSQLPVLFWVHGGGYEIGSGSQHGYEHFAKAYIPQDVIIVTVQYRLGFLGFFTDGSKGSGNMGLFDQAAALKYVKENIANFGGDPDRITIWGYSAGAASVSQLTLSPYTRDLYQNAIIMSASSFAGWATGTTILDNSLELAKLLDCEGKNVKKCMKLKTMTEIFDAVEKQGPTTQTIDILRWSPIIDGDFLPDHPELLVRGAPKKPTIIGMSNKEGSYFTVANMGRVIADFGLSAEEAEKLDENYIVDVIQKKYLYNGRYGDKQNRARKQIVDYYLHDNKPQKLEGNGYFLEQYSQLLSDVVFNVPIIREIVERVNSKTPVYSYLFEHFNPKIWKDNVPEIARGSPHANEYHYLFDMPVMAKIDMTLEPDSRIQHDLIQMVVSFAKTGRPNVQNIDWKTIDDVKNINFLNIASTGVSLKSGLFQEPLNFWNGLRTRYGFDIVDPASSYHHRFDHLKDEL